MSDQSEPTNPFQGDSHVSGTAAASSRQRSAYADLAQMLRQAWAQKSGRLILLTSADAGMGKTCVIDAISTDHEGDAGFIPLPTDAADLVRAATEAPSPVWLERGFRRLLSSITADLIEQNRLPASNPKETVALLRARPETVFDPRDTSQPIGSWFYENFNGLAAIYAETWAARVGASQSTARQLLEIFKRAFDTGGPSWPIRRNELLAGVNQQNIDATTFVGRLLTEIKPVVLVADHLDHCFRRPKTAWKLSFDLLNWLAKLPGASIIVALNRDVWDSSFEENLPQAIRDRLTEYSVTVPGLDGEEGAQVIQERLDASEEAPPFDDFLRAFALEEIFASQPERSISPRSLFRQAAERWRVYHRSTPNIGELDLSWREEPEPEFPAAPLLQNLPGKPGSLTETYAQRRDALWRAEETSPLSTRELASLFRMAGKAFPMLTLNELRTETVTAPYWRFDGNDILLGTESLENATYWENLLQASGELPPAEKGGQGFVKIVALSHKESTPDGVEPVDLDPWQTVCARAALETLDRAPLTSEAVRLLSTEVDFLWRQLTRPPKVAKIDK